MIFCKVEGPEEWLKEVLGKVDQILNESLKKRPEVIEVQGHGTSVVTGNSNIYLITVFRDRHINETEVRSRITKALPGKKLIFEFRQGALE